MDGNSNSDNPIIIAVSRMFLHLDKWKQCVRRVPRVELEPSLHSVWVTFPEITQELFSVQTIGELGAFCKSEEKGLPVDLDQVVDVVLILGHERFEFEGRIRYLQATGMAIEFMHPSEEVRKRIRVLFEPELLATTMVPYLSYTTTEPGSTATLIYSDGQCNRLQIALVSERILAVFLDLEILDAHLIWHKNEIQESRESTSEMMHPESQKKVLNFVKNLQGLTPEFLQNIESIITLGKAC